MPNYVPMEMQVGPVGSRWDEESLTALQVLSGILPISQVSSLPSCIQHAARLMPLEEVFKLVNPSIYEPPVEDKRTWREGTVLAPSTRGEQWTAMDIMAAYATKKGWVTAKAGRPDVNRAGNASEYTCRWDKISFNLLVQSCEQWPKEELNGPSGHLGIKSALKIQNKASG